MKLPKTLLACAVAMGLVAVLASDADAKKRKARPKKKQPAAEQITVGDGAADAPADAKTSGKGKVKEYDFTKGLAIDGKLRTPQLLYFLGRARQELERAMLESRSFIPEMVDSIEEEGL